MREYQEIKALNMSNARLKSKMKIGVIGVIKTIPKPVIWMAVLYFPSKSDFTSLKFFDLDTINNLT